MTAEQGKPSVVTATDPDPAEEARVAHVQRVLALLKVAAEVRRRAAGVGPARL